MISCEDFIKEFYDEKHPIIFQLRKNQGIHIDEVIEIMRKYTRSAIQEDRKNVAEHARGGAYVGLTQDEAAFEEFMQLPSLHFYVENIVNAPQIELP
jgi:hypothetical protein